MSKFTKDDLIEMRFEDLVVNWNEFCFENAWYDDVVYHNDQDGLDEIWGQSSTPLQDLARAIAYGEYNYQDTHFVLVNGNIKTFSWQSELLNNIDQDELIDWLNERGGMI